MWEAKGEGRTDSPLSRGPAVGLDPRALGSRPGPNEGRHLTRLNHPSAPILLTSHSLAL